MSVLSTDWTVFDKYSLFLFWEINFFSGELLDKCHFACAGTSKFYFLFLLEKKKHFCFFFQGASAPVDMTKTVLFFFSTESRLGEVVTEWKAPQQNSFWPRPGGFCGHGKEFRVQKGIGSQVNVILNKEARADSGFYQGLWSYGASGIYLYGRGTEYCCPVCTLPRVFSWGYLGTFKYCHTKILSRETTQSLLPAGQNDKHLHHIQIFANLKHFHIFWTLRPCSHRTRKQICMQICVQTLWCCLQPVWTLALTTVCPINCLRLLQGAPRPVWTGPKRFRECPTTPT